MAYIGARPLIGNYQICDALTASATADYTLQVGSVNVVPESANAMIVSLNSVIQAPGASGGFTVSGSTISFNTALTSSDVINFIYIFGDVLDIGTPTDGTVTAAKLAADAVITAKILDSNVTTAKIADNNVTLAKLGDGTQGDILYYGASGAPARLGFGTSGDFLKTQGTGANPTWATAGGGEILQIVQAIKTDSYTASVDETWTDFPDLTVTTGTLASSSSRIMVIVNVQMIGGDYSGWKITDAAGSDITNFIGDTASSRIRSTGGSMWRSDNYQNYGGAATLITTPGVTTAQTYKVQWFSSSASAVYLNRGIADSDSTDHYRSVSSITAIEIGA